MTHPYATLAFGESLAHWGKPLFVAPWQTTVILREFESGTFDAAGTYPFAVLPQDADIAAGLAQLGEAGAVSVVLVLDDFGYYTQSNIPQSLRQILVRRRQKRLDIFSLTHGFTNIPPALILYMTHICIFKTLDNPMRHKEKLSPVAFEGLLKTVREVNESMDRHKYQMVDMKALTQIPALA